VKVIFSLWPALYCWSYSSHPSPAAADTGTRRPQKSAGHVTSVTCHRATAKWWDCDVTYEVPQDSLGTSAEEIRAPAR